MDNVIFAEDSFTPCEINPYTGRPYSKNWVFIELADTDDYYMFNGGNKFVFKVSVSKKCSDWKYRIMDFIEYEQMLGKRVIIKISDCDFEMAEREYNGHCHTDNFLRDYEGRYLVHSTTADSYKKIVEDGRLKSWNTLKSEGKIEEDRPIGLLLGDHEEYGNYIMFTNGGAAGEIVVNSKNSGKIVMDTDTPYRAGTRLYFDAEKIAKCGLLIRDGVHLKVKNELPLKDFLLWTATPKNVGLSGKSITPRLFADAADRIFESKYT